jgi:hypothetical protein
MYQDLDGVFHTASVERDVRAIFGRLAVSVAKPATLCKEMALDGKLNYDQDRFATVSNIPKQLKTSFSFWIVNIETPHFPTAIDSAYKFLVKLSFLWTTYVAIVKGNDTLHRCDCFEQS